MSLRIRVDAQSLTGLALGLAATLVLVEGCGTEPDDTVARQVP